MNPSRHWCVGWLGVRSEGTKDITAMYYMNEHEQMLRFQKGRQPFRAAGPFLFSKPDTVYNLFSQNSYGSLNERSGQRPDFYQALGSAVVRTRTRTRMLTGVCTCFERLKGGNLNQRAAARTGDPGPEDHKILRSRTALLCKATRSD